MEVLSNSELQVLLRSVGEIWLDKVVTAFEQREEIDGEDLKEFQEGDFSAFVDEEAALQCEIKYVVRHAQELIKTLSHKST